MSKKIIKYGDSEFEDAIINEIVDFLGPDLSILYDGKRGVQKGVMIDEFDENYGLFIHKGMTDLLDVLGKNNRPRFIDFLEKNNLSLEGNDPKQYSIDICIIKKQLGLPEKRMYIDVRTDFTHRSRKHTDLIKDWIFNENGFFQDDNYFIIDNHLKEFEKSLIFEKILAL